MFIVLSMLAEIGGIISLNIFDKGVSDGGEVVGGADDNNVNPSLEIFLSTGGGRSIKEPATLCRNM